MKKLILFAPIFLLCFIPFYGSSQQVPEQYISAGLNNNLVLQDKKVTLEKSLVSLKEAKSLFLPTTWVEGQYSLAQGGRSIDIPVGDLVNPVYKTLNQLTGTNSFPTINNVSEQLLPNNFYDLRLKTTMPLINPDLKYNREIRQEQSQLKQNEIDIYKRELVKEIKIAYYNFLQSTKAILIYQNALEVVNQNLRVNQSLLANGKGLPAYVSRSESEVKQVESQLQNAINAKLNAKAYFNFLLNKPLTDSVAVAETDDAAISNNLFVNIEPDIKNREELSSWKIATDINDLIQRMNRSYKTPRLNAFVDLASQGYKFKVDSKSIFYLAGLQVQVPIFSGKRNLYKIEQTQLDAKAIYLNKKQTEQQLELSAFTSRNNAVTAYNTYNASLKQQESARQYFKLIDRGFKEGVNSFIEYLDARNQLTNAQVQTNINQYKVLVALADYERQTSSYSFK
ncbi:MAG: TolC family protein [Ginsengibacter sp.]